MNRLTRVFRFFNRNADLESYMSTEMKRMDTSGHAHSGDWYEIFSRTTRPERRQANIEKYRENVERLMNSMSGR